MSSGLAWRRCVSLAALALLAHAEPPRPECPPTAELCRFTGFATSGEGNMEYSYDVSGRTVETRIWGVSDLDIDLDCDELGVQTPILPRFPSALRVTTVRLKHCAPPQRGSYADALAVLNVTAFSELELHSVPSIENTTRAHLAGLDTLAKDAINGSLDLNARRPSFTLRKLTLDDARVSPDVLRHLPATLETLELLHTGAARVHLGALPLLQTLYLKEDFTVDVNVSGARALQELRIEMPSNAVPDDALPHSLRDVQYYGWNDTRAAPLTRCDHLESFRVSGDNDNSTLSLPDAWVARCVKLSKLTIVQVPLRSLPAALLARATALEDFACVECALTELPLGLFNDTLRLLRIDFCFNEIKSVPSGLFDHVDSLETLDLSHNQLTSAGAASLADLFSLRVLRLNNNPNLSELCDGFVNAIIYPDSARLRSLSELYLYHTNITRVCSNLREALSNLQLLDVDPIAFDNLTYMDLQYPRGKPGCRVNLGNGGEFKLLYTREDYETVLNSSATAPSDQFQALVVVSGALRCDCETYWAALAFHRNKNHVLTRGLRCGDTELSTVDVDTLTCDASTHCAPLHLPAHCSCRARPDYQHGAVVIVTCERANLTTLPRLPPASHKWRLHLANNNISIIYAADVSSDIVELDLRNNSIRHIDSKAAVKLANIPLQLAGNHQFECGCEAFDMLTTLLNISSHLQDPEKVMCVDGKRMTEAPLVRCASITGPTVAGLAVLLGFSLILVGLLAQPKTRRHMKTMLIAMGWLPPRPEPKDDCYRRFDAFVSYAHEDEKFVVEQLADRLERGPRPYRLCLHYRDWAPGEWIPAQIAASVRSSRRTLAVVSQHYVRSAWARAEFREAHAATLQDPVPRLVMVLLDDPDSLPLDPELNAYVRQNTYVRWGDPWFWQKLRQALPPPRALPPSKDATAAPPAPPAPPISPELPAPPSIP